MTKSISITLVSILILTVAVFLGSKTGKYLGKKKEQERQREFSEQFNASMQYLDIGDTLANHKFEVIGGDSVWLKDLLSERCILSVVLPECHDCVIEAQELKLAIRDSADSRHFIFATWDNPRIFEEMKRETGLAAPFLYDHRRAYFSKYDISSFPFNITLDENGVVLDMLSGPLLKEDFEEIINYNRSLSAKKNKLE